MAFLSLLYFISFTLARCSMEGCSVYWAAALCLLAVICRFSATARYYVKYIYFILHSAVFATAFIPIMLLRPGDWRNALIPAWGLRLLERPYGMKWEVTGKENMVQGTGSIVLLNHQSLIDLIALAEIWPVMDRCTVISKKEIFYLWPFGLASYLWGTIFIDRLNPDQARDTVNKTGQIVQKRQARLCMFPEGTRHGKEELLPFKKGAFHVAIASQLPIQPVVVSRYYFLDTKRKRFDPGNVRIEILPAISTEGYSKDTIKELIDKTYDVMQKGYDKVNSEVGLTRDLNHNPDKKTR